MNVHAYQVSEATRLRELETANEDLWLKVTVYNFPYTTAAMCHVLPTHLLGHGMHGLLL